MRFRLGVLLVFATLVCLSPLQVQPASAQAPGWTQQRPQIRIEDRTGDPRWRTALIHAVWAWSAEDTGSHAEPVYTSAPSFAGYCGFHGLTVSVCRSDNVRSNELGLTYVRLDSNGGLTDAYIEVTPYDMDDASMQMIACHEIGHALGLDHNPNPASCMHAPYLDGSNYGPDPGSDYQRLRQLYP